MAGNMLAGMSEDRAMVGDKLEGMSGCSTMVDNMSRCSTMVGNKLAGLSEGSVLAAGLEATCGFACGLAFEGESWY